MAGGFLHFTHVQYLGTERRSFNLLGFSVPKVWHKAITSPAPTKDSTMLLEEPRFVATDDPSVVWICTVGNSLHGLMYNSAVRIHYETWEEQKDFHWKSTALLCAMEDNPADGESPAFVLWNSQTKSLQTQQTGGRQWQPSPSQCSPQGFASDCHPAGQENLQFWKNQLFANKDYSVLPTGRFELPCTVAHCGRIHCLLDEPAPEAVLPSGKQGQNYQARKTKGSLKPFELRIFILLPKCHHPPAPM